MVAFLGTLKYHTFNSIVDPSERMRAYLPSYLRPLNGDGKWV
jgi:hypothetical protein